MTVSGQVHVHEHILVDHIMKLGQPCLPPFSVARAIYREILVLHQSIILEAVQNFMIQSKSYIYKRVHYLLAAIYTHYK